MYFGETQTTLDEKSRLTVPRKTRDTMDVLGHLQWFMARGFDKALFLFPRDEWDTIREQAAQYSAMDGKAIDFRRLFYGSVAEVRLDGQGRITVPPHLREHAQIDKDVALIGVGEHLELWSKENWQRFQERKDAEYREMASELFAAAKGQADAEMDGAIQ